jgi:hypothetical protein
MVTASPDGTRPRRDPDLDVAVTAALDQLAWWATALRHARAVRAIAVAADPIPLIVVVAGSAAGCVA